MIFYDLETYFTRQFDILKVQWGFLLPRRALGPIRFHPTPIYPTQYKMVYLPVHWLFRPSTYPALHTQRKPPGMFSHLPLGHRFLPLRHSLTKAIENKLVIFQM